jgi:ligand-binding sensor domain-containing protein
LHGRGGVYLSTNNGTSWTDSGIIISPDVGVFALAVSGTNLFAGTAEGIFLSTNNGTNWIQANTGLTGRTIHAFALSDNNLFAGTDEGVYLSTNNGTSWTAVNNGLTNTSVIAVKVNGPYLLAGTSGEGAWKRPLLEMVTAVHLPSNELPATYVLSQNYPNPFNPTTTISFSLPARSIVSLKIFDILGREVSTIVSGELQAGNYKGQWNAINKSSGVYFYRLTAGNFVDTKKLMVIK